MSPRIRTSSPWRPRCSRRRPKSACSRGRSPRSGFPWRCAKYVPSSGRIGLLPLRREKIDPNTKEVAMRHTIPSVLLVFLLFLPASCSSTKQNQTEAKPFNIMETTIEEIHGAYKSGQLTARQLVQMYLDRIEAYDKKGPAINSIITLNQKALEEADKL